MKASTLILCGISLAAFSSCANTKSNDNSDINPVIADKNFPTAFAYKDSKTQVISPYKPHNVIDIRGIKPGHLARDLSTAKIDKSTGQPITSSAKIFRVPTL